MGVMPTRFVGLRTCGVFVACLGLFVRCPEPAAVGAAATESTIDDMAAEPPEKPTVASAVDDEPCPAAADEAVEERPAEPGAAEGIDGRPHEDERSESERPAVGQPATAAVPPVVIPVRVRLRLDVAGELFAPAGADVPPVRIPIAAEARFDFFEQPAAAPVPLGTVLRRYTDATADLSIDGRPSRQVLDPDAREVLVALRGTTPSPYLENGFLTRPETDLLDTPFDPLLVDRLRPAAAVRVGDAWEVAPDAVAGLLAIDTVESGAVRARLTEWADGVATITVEGTVDGAADGAPTHVAVDGTCTIPLSEDPALVEVALDGAVAGVTMTIHERRQASHVAPGFEVEARIAMSRGSEPAPAASTPPAAGDSRPARRAGVGRPGVVWHCEARGRYDLVHAAGWRVVEEGDAGLVLRLVDHGALAAQCSITALPPGGSAPPTIADVQRDVERSLAGQFGRFEHASEATRTDGVRIVRVATAGTAERTPFRWIHYVLTDEAGHRVAATFMHEIAVAGRFGSADRELIDGLTLPGAGVIEDGPAPAAVEREARLPRESLTP